MKNLKGIGFGLLAIGCGVLGILFDSPAQGRLVDSSSERAAVIGAACYGQETALIMICSGGTKSDCTGCGCTMEHAGNDTNQGYAAESVTCNSDPACTYKFRRGSCTGG